MMWGWWGLTSHWPILTDYWQSLWHNMIYYNKPLNCTLSSQAKYLHRTVCHLKLIWFSPDNCRSSLCELSMELWSVALMLDHQNITLLSSRKLFCWCRKLSTLLSQVANIIILICIDHAMCILLILSQKIVQSGCWEQCQKRKLRTRWYWSRVLDCCRK